ncbi:hypothetical protein ETB97_007397 [Aspergillus alliaceus]|uniref:Uncharacterized protein n=1 Tax=Petromyces alliaceus TaxID=209559 RepID=A0A5N6FM49_PETAA|nr:uncharacterized protein BDW43DRAFT_320977 [Aspergillus alliaceus]KAB8230938.1 hypothetical protein BDW43DRAFT_320977 [Aspergillus alliaceus]KAF5864565.1 hypothetical protein ETB97_007397 [Aspergillus burnettii]
MYSVIRRKKIQFILVAAFFVIQIFHLRFLLSRRPTSNIHNLKYFTWETPDFAYFNNQFILHLASAVHKPLPSRKLLSPGITCPAIRGVQEAKVIPVTDVFEERGLQTLGYETNLQRWSDPATKAASTQRVSYYTDIVEGPSPIIEAKAITESYWQWSAIRFVLEAFVLPWTSNRWRSAAHRFQLSRPLQQCVDSVLPDIVPNAIALHLRMWPSDLSFGQEDACYHGQVPILRHIFSKCDWSGSYLYDNVIRVQQSESQPVIVATDDRKHPAIIDLVRRLGSRVHFMEMTETCVAAIRDAHPEDEIQWRTATYWPIVEAATMVQAESFVGSFWSTFSQLIAIRRQRVHRTFFVQNRVQEFVWDYRWLLILGLIGILGFFVVRVWRRSRR